MVRLENTCVVCVFLLHNMNIFFLIEKNSRTLPLVLVRHSILAARRCTSIAGTSSSPWMARNQSYYSQQERQKRRLTMRPCFPPPIRPEKFHFISRTNASDKKKIVRVRFLVELCSIVVVVLIVEVSWQYSGGQEVLVQRVVSTSSKLRVRAHRSNKNNTNSNDLTKSGKCFGRSPAKRRTTKGRPPPAPARRSTGLTRAVHVMVGG